MHNTPVFTPAQLQLRIAQQAELFDNKISYIQACRMLNTQTVYRPTTIAPDLCRWVSNNGLSIGYNKRNNLLLIKSSSLQVLFTCSGCVGYTLFTLCIQKKIKF